MLLGKVVDRLSDRWREVGAWFGKGLLRNLAGRNQLWKLYEIAERFGRTLSRSVPGAAAISPSGTSPTVGRAHMACDLAPFLTRGLMPRNSDAPHT